MQVSAAAPLGVRAKFSAPRAWNISGRSAKNVRPAFIVLAARTVDRSLWWPD